MRIYLARHGQNEDNAAGILNGLRDLPLTEQGRQQALAVSLEIKKSNIKFDAMLTSPLRRASETAQMISHETGSPAPKVEKLLIERDFGVMSGKPANQIKEMCSPDIIETDKITYFLNPKGAETFPELIDRARKLLEKIKSEYKAHSTILLVGHGDMGKMIYAAYYDLPWEDVLTQFHFGNSELLLLSEDSGPDEAHVFETEQFNH